MADLQTQLLDAGIHLRSSWNICWPALVCNRISTLRRRGWLGHYMRQLHTRCICWPTCTRRHIRCSCSSVVGDHRRSRGHSLGMTASSWLSTAPRVPARCRIRLPLQRKWATTFMLRHDQIHQQSCFLCGLLASIIQWNQPECIAGRKPARRAEHPATKIVIVLAPSYSAVSRRTFHRRYGSDNTKVRLNRIAFKVLQNALKSQWAHVLVGEAS